MEEKKKKFRTYLIITVAITLISYIVLYALFWEVLSGVLITLEGILIGSLISLLKVVILALMSFYIFRRWLKQDAIFTSDAYFLFGSFFWILVSGKILDLFWNLGFIGSVFDMNYLLFLLKIRFAIVVLTIVPILFVGLEAILTFVNLYKKKEMKKQQFNKIRKRIIIISIIIITILIILAPSVPFMTIMLPFVSFPMFLFIAIMFLYMYKNKYLSQANGLIIGLSFLLLIIATITRTVLSLPPYDIFPVALAEFIDIGVYILMFIGFITKPSYGK
ncbi:MAG: hypothetical protein EU531_11295 [Promethearchaeota archaeon]|nr:MAG: hypothetical protein EU531_11295 [Candidatus Lokiarchaeota archaeon]